jgi:hypothetical protein
MKGKKMKYQVSVKTQNSTNVFDTTPCFIPVKEE